MIAIGNDHAGLALKDEVIRLLDERGIAYQDFGTNTPESVDYPVFAYRVAHAVATGRCDKGIVICGTGIGVSIAANKVKGARCALCHEPYSAAMARQHNDANVLALGARVTGPALAAACIEAFLDNDFLSGRHQRRVDELSQLDRGEEPA